MPPDDWALGVSCDAQVSEAPRRTEQAALNSLDTWWAVKAVSLITSKNARRSHPLSCLLDALA